MLCRLTNLKQIQGSVSKRIPSVKLRPRPNAEQGDPTETGIDNRVRAELHYQSMFSRRLLEREILFPLASRDTSPVAIHDIES